MDQLIALLTNLLNLTKVAAVTVPGLLLAAAIAILCWPPSPIDLIPIASPNQAYFKQNPLLARGGPEPGHVTAACNVALVPWPQALYADSVDLDRGLSSWNDQVSEIRSRFHEATPPEVKYQLLLDVQQIRLAECMEAETAMKGLEKTENDQLAGDLTALEKERLNAQGPQRSVIENKINATRALIINNEQATRDRERNLASLQRYSTLVGLRLADPGRLRPKQDFNAFVGTQTTHVVGFLLLSIVLGVVIAPVRDALANLFVNRWLGSL